MFEHLLRALEDHGHLIEQKMEALLPEPKQTKKDPLMEAMRYSALGSGKRLRPFLTVATASLFGVARESALQTAAAIEFIHTYSLIHDDLPAMDNDDMRRGQPSCHVKFNEATAILAGDALLTRAFEILADPSTHTNPAVRCELVKCIARASGISGMVGGQMLDMFSDNKDLSINEIIQLQRLKTGELFAVSCESGAILGGAANHLRSLLRSYAHDIGLAFQITDDLLDAEIAGNDNSERQDKSFGKPTFVTALGKKKAQEQAKILTEQAVGHLYTFGKQADLLRDLAKYLVERKV